MLLVLGDRRFDVTHRMLVAGIVDEPIVGGGSAIDVATAYIAAGADVLVGRTPAITAVVCDRVEVPVGSEVAPGQVEFVCGARLGCTGPVDDVGPARIARVVSAIAGGQRLLLNADATTIGADRRVAEVMARLLSARAGEVAP